MKSVKGDNTMYEVAQNKKYPESWHVERIVDDGAVEVTVFSGPNADSRAAEYATFKNKTQ